MKTCCAWLSDSLSRQHSPAFTILSSHHLATALLRQSKARENSLVYLPFCFPTQNTHSHVYVQLTVRSKRRCAPHKLIAWYCDLMSNECNSEMERSPICIPKVRVYVLSVSCETKGFSPPYAADPEPDPPVTRRSENRDANLSSFHCCVDANATYYVR